MSQNDPEDRSKRSGSMDSHEQEISRNLLQRCNKLLFSRLYLSMYINETSHNKGGHLRTPSVAGEATLSLLLAIMPLQAFLAIFKCGCHLHITERRKVLYKFLK